MKQDDPQTYAIIGAAMEVHRQLGCGFLESVYQEALAVEMTLRGMDFRREAPLIISYKDAPLACNFRVDFLCFDDVIVELKAVQKLTALEDMQVLNYLKASGLRKALLLNFAGPSLQFKRLVLGE